MTDETIFTEQEREAMCLDDDCMEHGDGTVPCEIPSTKREAKAKIKAEQKSSNSAGLSLGAAEPKQATGKVVRSDE